MKLRIPVLVATCVAMLTATLAVPATASAQRIAVRRGGPRIVLRAYYYRPLFYDPWYSYGWYPSPYYGYGYGYGYGPRGYYDLGGSLRLQVSPRETEVFVDGYYAGTVDDFDGVFQRLNIEPGEHDLELYLPGYRSAHQKVYLQPGRTTRIRLDMEPLAPGDPAPVRPSGAPARPRADAGQGPGPYRRPAPLRPGARREEPPPPPDDAGQRSGDYGRISIRVQPADADILIDGEQWQGPEADERLVVEIAPGRHVIEVRKEGFRRYSTEVTVREGDTSALNIALTRQ